MNEERLARGCELNGKMRQFQRELTEIARFDGDLLEFLQRNSRLSKHEAVNTFIKLVELTIVQDFALAKQEFESL